MNRRMPLRECSLCRRLSAYVDRVGVDGVLVCGVCLEAIERAQEHQREGEGSGIPDPGALT